MDGQQASLEHLITVNKEAVAKLFGSDFLKRSVGDCLRTEEVAEANYILAEALYGTKVAALVWRQELELLDEMHQRHLCELHAQKDTANKVDFDRLGLVLVRPEISQITQRCMELISANGLEIVEHRRITIDFKQYWALYHHGLSEREALSDFPTRTLNYIEKECHLLLLYGDPANFGVQSISEYLGTKLKGRQGRYAPRTLRGDVAFCHLHSFITSDERGTFMEYANLALDPIGAYRHLARGLTRSDGSHTTADSPLLFYAGQGVHIPNRGEIESDLRILCSEWEISQLVAVRGLARLA